MKGKFDISKEKCYNQLRHFANVCPFPDKRIKKEEDQYPPSAFAMMCMDEERNTAKEAEEKESEENEEQPEEGEQHDVQEGAFKEMLLRCEEQAESAHDSTKLKFEMWDVTMRCVAHHMEPNVDHDDETQRTHLEENKDEEQVIKSHGTNMSTSQGDLKFQTHMVSCAPQEMKVWDYKDGDEGDVLINQEMDDQPSRGKRKCDEEDDQEPTAKPKKDIPEDDQENQDNKDSQDKEVVKKESIKEMFETHFKTTHGPQDDSEEPSIHPAVAYMDVTRTMQTIDVLQAMWHHQHQL